MSRFRLPLDPPPAAGEQLLAKMSELKISLFKLPDENGCPSVHVDVQVGCEFTADPRNLSLVDSLIRTFTRPAAESEGAQ